MKTGVSSAGTRVARWSKKDVLRGDGKLGYGDRSTDGLGGRHNSPALSTGLRGRLRMGSILDLRFSLEIEGFETLLFLKNRLLLYLERSRFCISPVESRRFLFEMSRVVNFRLDNFKCCPSGIYELQALCVMIGSSGIRTVFVRAEKGR